MQKPVKVLQISHMTSPVKCQYGNPLNASTSGQYNTHLVVIIDMSVKFSFDDFNHCSVIPEVPSLKRLACGIRKTTETTSGKAQKTRQNARRSPNSDLEENQQSSDIWSTFPSAFYVIWRRKIFWNTGCIKPWLNVLDVLDEVYIFLMKSISDNWRRDIWV